MILSLFAVIYLTNATWTHYVHELEATGQKPEHIQREEEAEEKHAAGLPTSSGSDQKTAL